MHTLKGIFLSLLAVSPIAVSLSVVSVNSANAQAAGQTLAQCVKELNDAYPYSIGSDVFNYHTEVCLNNLATQVPTESLGQCVAAMNRIYPYSVGSDVMNFHTETCNNLLKAQRSNYSRTNSSNSNNRNSGLYGAWAVKNGRWNGILRMRGNYGNLVLVTNSGAAVEQNMTLKVNPEGGYILDGEVLTKYVQGGYNADNFYFEQFSRGSFSVKNCDDGRQCYSVNLVYLGK